MEQGRSEDNLKMLHDQEEPPPPPDRQMNRHRPLPFQKCPRCDSGNTKFCYYNNYSLSQPRYFCKACRRYWTHGGTLRNVPIGGGCRKAQRSKPSPSSSLLSADMARNLTLEPVPHLSSHNLTGMISGHPFRPSPVMNNNPFYTGAAFMSSLAAMQSVPTGHVFQIPSSLNFGANMTTTLLPGITTPTPQGAPQFLAQNDHFLARQSLMIPPRPYGSWTERFTNRGIPPFDSTDADASAAGFWSNTAAVGNNSDGLNSAGTSFDPNQWSNDHPGFDPSL